VLQRPLTDEPLALDLVDTQWIDRGAALDLFDEPGGLASWLHEHGLGGEGGPAPSPVETALREARAALRAVLEQTQPPGRAQAEALLDAVLARGVLRRRLRHGAVTEELDVQQAWLPAWRAASSYLDLLQDRPERIRRCAHPACVLYFYDTSRNGTRRWCSMQGCGSRAKASRHYARTRDTTTETRP
jgi:predicted RNA-binding Zn ribbon-like protein